jgi:hypothetical protein
MRMVQHVAGGYVKRHNEHQNAINSKLPRALIFDIETSPMEFYGWRLWKQTVMPHQVIKDWGILSWSAKWLNEPEIMHQVVTPQEAIDRTEASIMQGLWDLIEEADFTITQNGKAFDHKKINTKFLQNGYGPPSPYQMVDTKIESAKHFSFSSNKLEYLCKCLKVEQLKNPQGFQLWVDCVHGSQEALDQMDRYCMQDIRATEDLYMELRPWIKSHPNMGVYVETDEPICPTCGCLDLTYPSNAYYATMVSKFKAFRCDKCGAIGRLRTSDLTQDTRRYLTASTAR